VISATCRKFAEGTTFSGIDGRHDARKRNASRSPRIAAAVEKSDGDGAGAPRRGESCRRSVLLVRGRRCCAHSPRSSSSYRPARPRLPGGPDETNCTIDEPDPVGRACKPATKLDGIFTANEVTQDVDHVLTLCTVSTQNAAPPADDGTGRVQFRVRNTCDHRLKVVELGTRVLTAAGNVAAQATQTNCHSSTCAYSQETPLRERQGLPPGEYVQEATVRLVLNEPGAPDPWTSMPPFATTAPDQAVPPQPDNQGICAPGEMVIRCTIRVPLTIMGTAHVDRVVEDCPTPWHQCLPPVYDLLP
jgi:hypothetical protein